MFEELYEMQKIMNGFLERTNKMSEEIVLAGIMMVLEEWCKANKRNMVETFGMLNEVCQKVNAELGSY